MTADGRTPDSDNTAGTGDGDTTTKDIDDEVTAIRAYLPQPLTSVAGTNTITASAAVLTAYALGNRFTFTPANANTAAATLNVNSLGAQTIKRRDGSTDLASGDLVAGQRCEVEYDGTNFRLLSDPAPVYGSGKIAVLAHQQTNGTAGGTATSGSAQTYPLNTEIANLTAGVSINTGTSEITLQPGDYEIEFHAVFYQCNTVIVRLYDDTAADYVDTFVATAGDARSGSNDTMMVSGVGQVTVSVATTLRFEYQVESTQSTDGLGQATTFSWDEENYGVCVIREILPIDLGSRNVDYLGVNGTADTTIRLRVTTDETLFDAETDDLIARLSKAANGDDVMARFEVAGSGRARIGLLGDQDLKIDISDDGSTWTTVAIIDKDDGKWQHQLPFCPPSYTVAGLPTASDWTGGLIYVSDETGGATLAFSDGTDWRRVQDRAVVS